MTDPEELAEIAARYIEDEAAAAREAARKAQERVARERGEE